MKKSSTSAAPAAFLHSDANPEMQEALAFLRENLNQKKVLAPAKYLAALKSEATRHLSEARRADPNLSFGEAISAYLKTVPHFVQPELILALVQHLLGVWQTREYKSAKIPVSKMPLSGMREFEFA